MLDRWRKQLPQDSIFRNPLVFEIAIVLILKIILLVLIWQIAFKPLKPTTPPNIDTQLLSSSVTFIKQTNIKQTYTKQTYIKKTKESQHD